MRTLFQWTLVALLALSPGFGRATPPERAEPTGELTFEQVLVLATSRSPEIAAAESETLARQARLVQAGALPNPELAGTIENFEGDVARTGGVQSTLQLSQRLELGGDRPARKAAASAARDLARWDLESRRLDVIARAARGFVDVLSAQRRLELADATIRLAEEVRSTVHSRVEAGKASPIEETRAQVALATERIDRERAAADLFGARSRLAATWGSTSPGFDRVAGDLNAIPPLPSLESLAADLERNPEVARWTSEIAEREALLRVEQARSVPDVTVGGGYRRFELGSDAFLATISFPLPLLDGNRGARIEARERIARAREERRAALVRLRQQVDETHASLARVQSEVRSLGKEVLPGAESVYAAVSEGYRLGRFGYMEVLDARRTLAAVSAQLVRAQAEMHRAFADLSRLRGEGMNDLTMGEQQK
ncbi:MAG: TolC family protein [Acidobacteria bacterium]|nr:TolC family protein [Acidobacteriota bacterium]